MIQSKGVDGNLKPEHKKTTNRATSGIDHLKQRGRWYFTLGPTHRRQIKKESNVINHNLVNSHACSLPHNIHVVTYLFAAVTFFSN